MTGKFAKIAIFSTLVLWIGCGTTATPLREQGELRGEIYVLGSEPFTHVALALDETNSIVLLCPPEVEKFLRSHQGESAKVTYDGITQVPEGQAVHVTSAEMVKK
jgi:hypothetical protein